MPGHPGRKTADLPENPGLPYQADRRPVRVLDREVDLAPVMPARGRGSHTHNRKSIRMLSRRSFRAAHVRSSPTVRVRAASSFWHQCLALPRNARRDGTSIRGCSASKRQPAPKSAPVSQGSKRRGGSPARTRCAQARRRRFLKGCEYIPSTSHIGVGILIGKRYPFR